MPILQGSEGATLNGGNYIDVNGSINITNVGSGTRKGEGIKLLLSHVQSEAIHDSHSRRDLGCYPGTREEYIGTITRWGRGESEPAKRAFLMTGPAGTGKSAIARTCARELKATGNLGASFFFYRPSRWNDPKKFVPTIVYQLTTQYSAYHDYIDAAILDNPLVLEKEMRTQFQELLVKPPLRQNVKDHGGETDLVIVIDGLDECETVDAQLQIIELITTSVHERTTPFSWAFFSRPEPPITSAFSSAISTNVTWTLPLSLSGNADSDIEAYFRGSFQVIRAKLNIPPKVAWPEEKDICRLVSQSAGLFAYAATAMRYIDGRGNGTPGLEQRLHGVLQVDSPSAENPFSALDHLYTLLMMQIPEGVLYDTLSLLYLDQSNAYHNYTIVNPWVKVSRVASYCLALGLSTTAFHTTISNLYSVLQVTKSEDDELDKLQFYHKSFLDFLVMEARSKIYFIRSQAVLRHCLKLVVRALSPVSGTEFIPPSRTYFPLQAYFTVVEEHSGTLEESTLQEISQVRWKNFRGGSYRIDFRKFIQKIPATWRPKIIRPSSLLRATSNFTPDRFSFFRKCSAFPYSMLQHISAILKPERREAMAYILGNGKQRVFMERDNIARHLTGKYWGINIKS